MTIHEYIELENESKFQDCGLTLWNRARKSFFLFTEVKSKHKQAWMAYTEETETWHPLDILEYREKQTPGKELEQELERCVENFIDGIDTTRYIKQRYVYAWLEKHKDLLDKEN